MSIEDSKCKICKNSGWTHDTGLCPDCHKTQKETEVIRNNTLQAVMNGGWPDSKEIIILLNNILAELKELNKKIESQPKTNVNKVIFHD